MARAIAALVAGLLFGLGLSVSQMVSPAKVLGFLDLAGDWDPSLAFVMAGAVLVTFVGYRVVLRRRGPILDAKFNLPTRRDIDAPLLLGALTFGVGWGLVGFCPGPALTALAVADEKIVGFVVAMLAGMALDRVLSAEGWPGRPRAA